MNGEITAIPIATIERRALPCVYGCTNPLTCPYEHRSCLHCAATREGSGWAFDPARIYDFPYLSGHPLPQDG